MADVFVPGFQWDEDKNQRNIARHKIDFREVIAAFSRPMLDIPDIRKHHEVEDRTNSIGEIGDTKRRHVHVTHTERDGDIRIISARRADAKEVQAYHRQIYQLQYDQQRAAKPAQTPAREDLADQIKRELANRSDAEKAAVRSVAEIRAEQRRLYKGRERERDE